MDETLGKWSPLGRPGYPDDISGVIALLASPESQWITGLNLTSRWWCSHVLNDTPLRTVPKMITCVFFIYFWLEKRTQTKEKEGKKVNLKYPPRQNERKGKKVK